MEKCEKCGRNYTKTKYVIRERFANFLDSILVAGFLLMIPLITPNTTLTGFAFFVFLAGCVFALNLAILCTAKTKEEMLANLTEELKKTK